MSTKALIPIGLCLALLASCAAEKEEVSSKNNGKPVIYQVFTRLFGNQNTTNKPWGTIEENGVGKFNDFTDVALGGIKDLGVTHIWYTGILHHASLTDYTAYGIARDDPDVVKGRAGSPYAIRDYYSVDPDLAQDPARRLDEFKALIKRTHDHDMKVVIDLVPNHIARAYKSISKPIGVADFGAADDISVAYARNNNFYYIEGEDFQVPNISIEQPDLGQNGQFAEFPAKWTGNGSRKAQPGEGDWYETVKINFGVRPDGSHDFASLPTEYANKTVADHVAFWADKDVPDSWIKFKDIALYWLAMGVDGLRYDMAEMVPVEFWSYLNSHIKVAYPDTFLLAEIYQPKIYREYIHVGKMDYIYDKVGLYDTLKGVIQGKQPASDIAGVYKETFDIESHMLHFLENHDEARIANNDFAASANAGKPAMVVSTLIGSGPTMVYFGQDVGEKAGDTLGFGEVSDTSIFDYVGVPAHQRWMNDGKFDGGKLSEDEKELHDFYSRLLNLSSASLALDGGYYPLTSSSDNNTDEKTFSFVRWWGEDKLIIITNFDSEHSYDLNLRVPQLLIDDWALADGDYPMMDQLYGKKDAALEVRDSSGEVSIVIEPLQSFVFKIN